jgi:hypothetical protein
MNSVLTEPVELQIIPLVFVTFFFWEIGLIWQPRGGSTGRDFPVELIAAPQTQGRTVTYGITSPSIIWEHGNGIWEQLVHITWVEPIGCRKIENILRKFRKIVNIPQKIQHSEIIGNLENSKTCTKKLLKIIHTF